MPETIAIAIITATAGAAAAGGVVLATVTFLVGIGLSYGLSVLASMFLSQKPDVKPSDRQFISNAAIQPRIRAYGTVRLSGMQVFMEAYFGVLWRVLAIHDGEIDAVVEHLLEDKVVDVANDGSVAADPFNGKVHIYYRTGTDNPSYYSELGTAFPQWTTTALGKGVAHAVTSFQQVSASRFNNVYPRGENTVYKQTIRASKIWDCRDPAQHYSDPTTWLWSDNAVLVILDHLLHRTGLRVPVDWILPEIESWKTAADICDEPVVTRDGSTVKRYCASMSYSYDQRPADVHQRLMSSCNARMWGGSNGGLAISVGAWTQVNIRLGDESIEDYDVFSGADAIDVTNTITATYTEPAIGYVECDAAAWTDDAAIAMVGVQTSDAQLYAVPNHNQCRRLMKQVAAKLNPAWHGRIRTNLIGLSALNERFISIAISELDLDITAEIDSVEFVLNEGMVVSGLVIQFSAIGPEAFEFNPGTEEKFPSASPSSIDKTGLAGVGNFDVTIQGRGNYAVGVATWNAFDTDYLQVEVEYRVQGSGSWLTAQRSAEGATSLETPALMDGETYEFRARTIGVSQTSNYTSILTRVVIVDTYAPDPPVGAAVSIVGSTATISGYASNSSNYHGTLMYRGTVADFSQADPIHVAYSAPSAAFQYADVGLSPGTYWWWVVAINGSGVESAAVLVGTGVVPG